MDRACWKSPADNAAWAILRKLHLLSVEGFSDYVTDDNAAVRYWAAIGLSGSYCPSAAW